MLFLSLDFGTSSIKGVIADEKGNILNSSKAEYPYQLLPGEKVELKDSDFKGALKKITSAFDSDLLDKVEVLCYDTFSPSPVFLDDSGNLVCDNIITHLDRRSRSYSKTVDDVFGNQNYKNITGILPFAGGCSLMTLLWFKDNAPDVMKKARHIGHLPTYVHYLFTKKWAVDLVNASMLGVYETTSQGGWSGDIIKAFGLPSECFDEIVEPGRPFGTLTKEAADFLGLKQGITVTMGTNDMAAAQEGALNNRAGLALNSAGSSDMISILTDKPVTDDNYYLRNAARKGLWQIYATTAGGFAVDWFYKEFCRDLSKKEYYRLIDESLDKELVIDEVFTPYLTGDRQSLEKKTASINGLTLASTREKILVAMLKSIQGVLYETIQRAAKFEKIDSVIKVTGGMVTDSYIKLKEISMPGYSFKRVDDCTVRGNVLMSVSGLTDQ
ncbi:MAG: sugar kinase [Clostridia bacterium]|nr:sugar kinase [Clostridia bacterium]